MTTANVTECSSVRQGLPRKPIAPVVVYALLSHTGGEWIVLDNLATRRGLEKATEKLLHRNRDTVGPLAVVPVDTLDRLPAVQ